MTFTSWLRQLRWFLTAARIGISGPAPKPRRNRAQLWLEALEDRLAPAVLLSFSNNTLSLTDFSGADIVNIQTDSANPGRLVVDLIDNDSGTGASGFFAAGSDASGVAYSNGSPANSAKAFVTLGTEPLDIETGSTIDTGLGDISLNTALTINQSSTNAGSIEVFGDVATNNNNLSITGNAGVEPYVITGVDIEGGTLNSGTGNITVTGVGASSASLAADGDDTNANGVAIENSGFGIDDVGSVVEASGSGTITITGTGGNGGPNDTGDLGVAVTDSTISAADGTVTITATASGTGSHDHGLGIFNSASVTTTGLGNITLTGTASQTVAGGNSQGVSIEDSGTQIQTQGSGNIEITGTGGNGGAVGREFGIAVAEGAHVQATGTGSVTLNGTDTQSSGASNFGVYMFLGPGNLVSTASGDLSITGSSAASAGIEVESQGQIQAGGFGNLTLNGNGSGAGIFFDSTGSGISAGSGIVTLDADQIDLGSQNSVQGTGPLIFGNAPGSFAPMQLGGNDIAGTLVFTTTDQAAIKAGFTSFQFDSLGHLTTASGLSPFNKSVELDAFSIDVSQQITVAGDLNIVATGNVTIDSMGGGLTATATAGTTGQISISGATSASGGAPFDAIDVFGSINAAGGVTLNGISEAAGGTGIAISGTVQSNGGSILITGAGATAGTLGSTGVAIVGGTVLLLTNGSLEITGTGGGGSGAAAGSLFVGVLIENGGKVSSAGSLEVDGIGGSSTSNGQYAGVLVRSGGQISETGQATVTVNGTGGIGPQNNFGVEVTGNGSSVIASDNNTTITGIGGGIAGDTSKDNIGVVVDNEGAITGGGIVVNGTGGPGNGTGNSGIEVAAGGSIFAPDTMTLTGNGGSGAGGEDAGVLVTGDPFGGETLPADAVSSVISHLEAAIVTGNGNATGASANSDGVFVEDGGLITASNSGTSRIVGTAGVGSGFGNCGVVVAGSGPQSGAPSQINSGGGNVTVFGDGGGNASPTGGGNDGLDVLRAGLITAGGSGTVTVTGIGGTGDIADAPNFGIAIVLGAVTSGGSGAVTLTGTGGAGAGGNNAGVFVAGASALVASGSGATNVMGTGSSGDSGSADDGVEITSNAIVSASGTDPVTVVGIGGSDSGNGNLGVLVAGGTVISAADLAITGTGGGTGTSQGNFGVQIGSSAGGLVTITAIAGNVSIIGTTGTGTNGANDGIDIESGSKVSASVSVALNGTATAGAPAIGIAVQNQAKVQGTGAGTIVLEGTAPGGAGNIGLFIDSSGAILAGGGDTGDNLALQPNSTLIVPLDPDKIASSGYQAVEVDGFVSLGGATLQTPPFTGTMPENASFNVFHENSAVPNAVGSFAGIAEGGTVTLGTTQFILTYVGGSGNDVVLNLPQAPKVTTNPASQSVTAGDSVTFTAAATGSPTPNVRWQESVHGGAFADIGGETTTTTGGVTTTTLPFTPTAADDGDQFDAVFTNSQGMATSTSATLTVNVPPNVTTDPASQSVTAGDSVAFTAAANGSPTPVVQWQESVQGGAFADIGGETTTTTGGVTTTTLPFTPTAADNGDLFQAVFTNAAGTDTTNPATLTVNSAPEVTTPPASQTVTVGQPVTFEVVITGNPAPTIQWQESVNGGPFGDVGPATDKNFTFTFTPMMAADNGDQFQAVVTNSLGTATSDPATLTVNFAPTVKTPPVNQTVILGGQATFTALASGNPTPTIVWQESVGGGPFATIPGASATTFSFTPTAADNGDQFRAIFTNSLGSVTSGNATLTVAGVSSNNADNGPGSLRQALLDANNSPGSPHTIQFQLAAGSQTIILQTALPTVAGPLTLSLDATQNVMLILPAGDVWTDNQSLSISGPGSISIGSGIEGTGDLSIGADTSFTATDIIQEALVIGGSAGSSAVVTIAASGASGNPLTTLSASSAATPNLSVVTAASHTSSVAPSEVASVSATGTKRSRDAAARLLSTFSGIGSTDLIQLSERLVLGGEPSRSESAPRQTLSRNEFAVLGNRAWLDAAFSPDLEGSNLFRLRWSGADLPPADDSTALGMVDELFASIGTSS